jgi:PPOX class probable F420-dependent enzyme
MSNNERSKITMSDEEIATFLDQSRTATMATNGPDHIPHLVAMWYGVIDGKIYFETKTKSQKAQNLRRDDTIVAMIEAGDSYDQLRGISIEGTATIIEDDETGHDEYWAAAVNVFERYTGPYTEDLKPIVDYMMNKRIVVRIEQTRIRTWDHRKMGMGAVDISGTTAQYL